MWFRRKKQVEVLEEDDDEAGHSVFLHYALGGGEFGTEEEREVIYALEDRLEAVIDEADGWMDGHEFDQAEAVVIIYGKDKDRLWTAVRETAQTCPFRPAYALLDGGTDVAPTRVEI